MIKMEDAWRCYMCRLSRLFHPLPQCFYRRSVLLWYRHARLNWVKLISPALWASLNRYYTHPPFILNTPVQRNHGFWSGISTFHWDHWDRASGVFSLVWTGDGITIPMTQEKRGPKKKTSAVAPSSERRAWSSPPPSWVGDFRDFLLDIHGEWTNHGISHDGAVC